jgi:hypothetical protein
VPFVAQKTKSATLSKLKAAQSVVLTKEPKLSVRWQQEHVHAQATGFVSRLLTGGQSIPGQHSKCFTKSHVPKNVVPLGFCCGGFSSTAGYDPATKPNFR